MNRLSVNQVNIDYTRPINSRAKLDTGKLCNLSCEFCYYKKQLSERDSLAQIKGRIDYIQAYGIEEIDLSGGESSVEPNWFAILDYCKGKFNRISCLSHGGKFSNLEFAQRSHDAGLREILFSLHGFTEEVHDRITGKKGSFNNLLKAIANAHALGIEVRINTTLYWINYNKVDVSLLRSLCPTQVNFIALNYWGDNAEAEPIDYTLICNAVKGYIDQLTGIEVNARYFPLCYMLGYEQYVKNHYDHIYDLKDWNKAIYNEQLDTSIPYTHEQKVDHSFSEASRIRLQTCFKTDKCTGCKYFFTCDGIENQLKGHVEPRPVIGIKITCV